MKKLTQLSTLVILAVTFSLSSCSKDFVEEPIPVDIRDQMVGTYTYEDTAFFEDGTEKVSYGTIKIKKAAASNSIEFFIGDDYNLLIVTGVNMLESPKGIVFDIAVDSYIMAGKNARREGLNWKELGGTKHHIVFEKSSGIMFMGTSLYYDEVLELTTHSMMDKM